MSAPVGSGPEPPDGPVLIVSPHLDDAALSCFWLIGREEPVEVLNVFAGTPEPPVRSDWDARTGFDDSSQSMVSRRAEDAAAFSATPHRVRYLELLDSAYLDRPRPPGDRQAIAAEIADWCRTNPEGTVAIPAGVGSRGGWIGRLLVRVGREPGAHPDHVFVRDAALPAALGAGGSVLLYEELPYLRYAPGRATVKRVVRELAVECQELVAAVDPTRKAAMIGAYASQLGELVPSGPRLDRPEALPPNERYWALAGGEAV